MNIHIMETKSGWLLEIDNRTIGLYDSWPQMLENLNRFLSTNYSAPASLY